MCVAIKSPPDWRQWILGRWEICRTCSTHFAITWVALRLIANTAADRVVTEELYPKWMCTYPNTSLLKTLYLVHHQYGFHMGYEVCLLSLGKAGQDREDQMKKKKKKKALFPAGSHDFKNPKSFPSATEPNIWLNEEAAEHDNVILVQACEPERNNTKWEVAFGNETSTSLNRGENSPNVLL